MTCSVCMITYNEQEFLPRCLAFLRNFPQITEIIIVDSFSTDDTVKIVGDFSCQTNRRVVFQQHEFKSFGDQRNISLSLASEPWILIIDADETYTAGLGRLLTNLETKHQDVNFVRFGRLTMFPDDRHVVDTTNIDPQIRIVRREYARYVGIVHESLFDEKGRNLHCAGGDRDCLNCDGLIADPEYNDLIIKHYVFLKSNAALVEKGQRWGEVGVYEESARRGIPVYPNFWFDTKQFAHPVKELPVRYYDATMTA